LQLEPRVTESIKRHRMSGRLKKLTLMAPFVIALVIAITPPAVVLISGRATAGWRLGEAMEQQSDPTGRWSCAGSGC
jgi:hypothetical protein